LERLFSNLPAAYPEDCDEENTAARPHSSSNRANTVYATHQVYGSIEDVRNYECFISEPFDFSKQPLIFVDDKDLTRKIAQHLNTCLPAPYRNQKIIRHYHRGVPSASP